MHNVSSFSDDAGQLSQQKKIVDETANTAACIQPANSLNQNSYDDGNEDDDSGDNDCGNDNSDGGHNDDGI